MRGKQMTEVKILYEDKDIIVVVKPAGMASAGRTVGGCGYG